jgi:magnesium-transporting ATPase (P-type)
MNGIFTLAKLRNGTGRGCSSDRKEMPSARAAQVARQTLGETLAAPCGGLDGLVELHAVERRAKNGPNQAERERPPHWLVQSIGCFTNPFVIVLITPAVIAHVGRPDHLRSIIIVAVAAISAGPQFPQQYRSALAVEKLKALVRTAAMAVWRPSGALQPEPREIPTRELVPRDPVRLSVGDLFSCRFQRG